MATTNMTLNEVYPTISAATPNVISLIEVVSGIAPVAGMVFKRPRELQSPMLSKYFKENNAPKRDPIICVVPKVGGGVYWLDIDTVFPGSSASIDGYQVTGDVFANILNLTVVENINVIGLFVGTIKNGVITV